MATDNVRLTLKVSPAAVAFWRNMARIHGFVTTSGRMSNQGNLSALFEALARGDLEIHPAGPEADQANVKAYLQTALVALRYGLSKLESAKEAP